jgi:arylsulfatase A-like enzyme
VETKNEGEAEAMTDKKRPHIVLIVIDAVRARNVDIYGTRQGVTPTINQLAQGGVVFENTYSVWNTTDQSLTSILTGKYPISHGITHHGDRVTDENLVTFQKTGTRTIAQILKDHGYKTTAVDWMGRWFKSGFDAYGIKRRQGLAKKTALYLKYALNHTDIFRHYAGARTSRLPSLGDLKGVLSTFLFTRELAEIQDARLITDSAIESIKSADGDSFFLFVHYWDTHTPYNCPKRFRRYKGTDRKKRLADKYLGAIRYVDEQLERLFEALKEKGLWDNTLIIVTSDHGESLTEHGIFFDHHGLYDVTTHVPLILRHPTVFSNPRRVSGLVQHTDLVPTILDILSINDGDLGCDGRSLVPLIRGDVAEIRPFTYSEESYVQKKRAIRTRTHKYIQAADGVGFCSYCHKIHGGPEELYDLTQDPSEEVNLIDEKPAVRQIFKKELDGFVEQLILKKQQKIKEQETHQGESKTWTYSADEQKEIEKRLRGFGYMD